MTDKKPTDAEIIKGLEICADLENHDCKIECVYCDKGCDKTLLNDVLDLIDRLQSENECFSYNNKELSKYLLMYHKELKQAKAENERLEQYHDDMESAIYEFREDHAKVKFFKKEIKAEAYKEFAERLKKCSFTTEYSLYDDVEVVRVDDIDDLLKELVGE